MTERNNKKKNKIFVWLQKCFYTLVAIAIFSLMYVFQIEPIWFEVVPVSVTVPDLSPAFDGFKIAQISDIHADTSMNQKKLTKIASLIARQQPDIIAMTGDFVTATPNAETVKLLENAFEQLSPKEKTLAVLGNHDHWANPNQIRAILNRSNVIDISNSLYTSKRGDARLVIAGVDDYWENKSDLDSVLQQLQPLNNVPAILLAHEPDFADISATSHRFVLQISGHSHGGQVRIPFKKPPVLPLYAQKYPVGRYQVKDMIQYTNRGVGMVLPAVRFNCRPEITVFTLNSQAKT
ncbi:MAG: metallophosphoesterase [Cyanobacteria bacterium J06621_12]